MAKTIISEPAEAPPTATSIQAAALLFEEISSVAFNADEFCRNIPVDDDPEVLTLQMDYLRDTVRRIGWLADRGAKKTGSDEGHPGGADAWLLSPRCLEAQGDAA
jgi:hypothetical protein